MNWNLLFNHLYFILFYLFIVYFHINCSFLFFELFVFVKCSTSFALIANCLSIFQYYLMSVHIVFSYLFLSLFSVTFMGGLSKVLLASTSLEYLVHPVSFCWAVWSNSGIDHCYISLVEAFWSSGSFLSWCHFPIPLEKATTDARS